MGMLLEDGTEKRAAQEISRGIEDLGGILSLSESSGSMKVLTPDLEVGLDIFFDCLMHSNFPQDRLEAKRDRLLAHIEDEESKSSTKAQELFYAMIYGQHPLGRPTYGTMDKVRALTRKDCQSFYQSLFQPNNLIIAFVGDFDSEKVTEAIKKRTSEWKNKPLPKQAPIEIPTIKEFQQKILSDPDSAQLYMYIGHVGVNRKNPDYYRLLVMDNLLGTGPGFTDRLSSSLRDRQGLAYTVSATITGSATEEFGVFTGYIGTFPDKFGAVKEGFLKEIKRIREEVPNKEEVEDVKKYLIGSLAFRLSTNSQIANQLIQIERYGLGFDYLDHFRKQIESVKPEDIQTVAKKYLQPERLILVASGPVDENGKPLKKSKD
jgi:zinc protease